MATDSRIAIAAALVRGDPLRAFDVLMEENALRPRVNARKVEAALIGVRWRLHELGVRLKELED